MDKKELSKWRKKKKLTQEAAAQKFNVKVDTWRKWEQGRNPVPDLLEQLLKATK